MLPPFPNATLLSSNAVSTRGGQVLRERLEQELVQLRARLDGKSGAGYVARQSLDSACRAQVDTLVDAAARSGAAGGWSPAVIPKLRAWALEQARGPIVDRLLRLLEFEAVVDLKTLEVENVCSARSRDETLARLAASGALPHGLLGKGALMAS